MCNLFCNLNIGQLTLDRCHSSFRITPLTPKKLSNLRNCNYPFSPDRKRNLYLFFTISGSDGYLSDNRFFVFARSIPCVAFYMKCTSLL